MSTSDIAASKVSLYAERQVCDSVVSQPHIPEAVMWLPECYGVKEVMRQVYVGDRVLDVLWHRGEAGGGAVEEGSCLTGAGLWTGG